MTDRLLDISNLKTYFFMDKVVVPAVDGVSFHIEAGETVGMVGESGCGKSITSLSIMRLVPSPHGRIVSGEIWFEGENLLRKRESEMRKIRGHKISMIFQEPMTSLNPVYTVGYQIREAIRLHEGLRPRDATEKAVAMLRMVGIPCPEARYADYPHQMSGGMRQRVMIAMALSCRPKLLIADEPTTALDVTIQAQILELMKELKRSMGMAILIITHDLGVIAEMAERVLVMYAGQIVEEGDVGTIFKEPLHPYTRGLLASMPRIDATRRRLHVIEGNVPEPGKFPQGCRFHPRCGSAKAMCRTSEPPVKMVAGCHRVKCWMGDTLYQREEAS